MTTSQRVIWLQLPPVIQCVFTADGRREVQVALIQHLKSSSFSQGYVCVCACVSVCVCLRVCVCETKRVKERGIYIERKIKRERKKDYWVAVMEEKEKAVPLTPNII